MEKLRKLEENSNGAPIVSFIEDGVLKEIADLSVSDDSSTEIDPAEADAMESECSDDWEIVGTI